MKKDYTHIAILLDKSGSMDSIRKDVIGGLNSLIDEQGKLPGTATVTLAQFDYSIHDEFSGVTGYVETYSFLDIKSVPPLTLDTYKPRGNTALRDSLAKLIEDTGAKLATMPENERPERVMIVVQTDGQENASKKVTNEELKKMVKHQTEKYNWQFMFLGANIDAFAAAATYGFKAGNTAQFAATAAGAAGSYMATSNVLSMKRSVKLEAMNNVAYSDKDRDLAAGNNPQQP